MSWTGTTYPYSGGQLTSNVTLTGSNPDLGLVGTETGGGTVNLLEIDGGLFILNNVLYNTSTSQFNLVNSAMPGSGMFIDNSGSVTMYYAAAATAAWTTWPTTLWGYTTAGSLNVTDINTEGVTLTIEAPNITHTLPNTSSGGLTVTVPGTTYEPYIAVQQNASGGGKWDMATTNNQLVFHNTPYGGTTSIAATVNATGGPGNLGYIAPTAGILAPVLSANGGSYAVTTKIVGGTASIPVANAQTGSSSLTITLTGNAVFSSSAYLIICTPGNGITGWSPSAPCFNAINISASQFSIGIAPASGSASGSQTAMVDWVCIGA